MAGRGTHPNHPSERVAEDCSRRGNRDAQEFRNIFPHIDNSVTILHASGAAVSREIDGKDVKARHEIR